MKNILVSVAVVAGMIASTFGPAAPSVSAAPEALGTWPQSNIADPPNLDSGVLGKMSCVTENFCAAVGSYDDTSSKRHGMIYTYDGAGWTMAQISDPASTYDSYLSKVSCTSATFCVAIGNFRDSSTAHNDTRGLIYTYNGTTWTSSVSPQPAPDQYVYLNDIECLSAMSCQIVGAYQPNMSVDTHLLAMTYNGSSWSLVPITEPSDASRASLQSLDCVSATFCQAVGGYVDGSNVSHVLNNTYDGNEWTLESSSDPSGTYDMLSVNMIRCVSTSFCQAIGQYSDMNDPIPMAQHTFTQSYNGSSWTNVAVSNTSGFDSNYIYAMECTSTSSCYAAGSYEASGGSHAYMQTYTPSGWSAHVLPEPTGALNSSVVALSCPVSNKCRALGSYTTNNTTYVGLSMYYDGTTWTAGDGLTKPSATYSNVADMDCVNITSCQVLGTYFDSSLKQHLMAGSYANSVVSDPGTSPIIPVTDPSTPFVTNVNQSLLRQTGLRQAATATSADQGADTSTETTQSETTPHDTTPLSQSENNAANAVLSADQKSSQGNWWWTAIAIAAAVIVTILLLLGKRLKTRS